MDVLIVEDSEVVREEIAAALTELAGVNRVIARSGLGEAREALDEQDFDVWVLDFQLPDGTAIELLEERQNDPELSHTRVVVATAHATPVVRKRCLEAGADCFFDKASGANELAPAVASIATPTDAC